MLTRVETKKEREILLAERTKIVDLLKLLESNERYQIAQAMDLFYDLSASHQDGLIHYLIDQNLDHFSIHKERDSTEYLDVIRDILFYYTGREDLGQPSKEELIAQLKNYITSEEFKRAEEADGDEDFSSLLEKM